MAEGADVESMKKAIRKSRVVYNRGGADEQPADTGGLHQLGRGRKRGQEGGGNIQHLS